ncbi:MAG: PDZ domain-containing protein, partial [Myxococcota bacterium]|nr:PDZ domain-containing protein [Myxococcota bacterium]
MYSTEHSLFSKSQALATVVCGLVFLLLSSGLVPLHAEEARVRGDLPPLGANPDELPLDQLTHAEARQLFQEIHRLLSQRLGNDRIGATELYLGAIQGMLDQVNSEQAADRDGNLSSLPPTSMLLSAGQAKRLQDALRGQVTGIGIEFQLYGPQGVIFVSRVLPGSPAQNAGLLPGDQIVAIDGKRFLGKPLQDVLRMLQGPDQ